MATIALNHDNNCTYSVPIVALIQYGSMGCDLPADGAEELLTVLKNDMAAYYSGEDPHIIIFTGNMVTD